MANSMNFCPGCGQRLSPEFNCCPNCGRKLSDSGDSAPINVGSMASQSKDKIVGFFSEKRKSFTRWEGEIVRKSALVLPEKASDKVLFKGKGHCTFGEHSSSINGRFEMTSTAIHFYDVPTLKSLLPGKHEATEYICGIEYADIESVKKESPLIGGYEYSMIVNGEECTFGFVKNEPRFVNCLLKLAGFSDTLLNVELRPDEELIEASQIKLKTGGVVPIWRDGTIYYTNQRIIVNKSDGQWEGTDLYFESELSNIRDIREDVGAMNCEYCIISSKDNLVIKFEGLVPEWFLKLTPNAQGNAKQLKRKGTAMKGLKVAMVAASLVGLASCDDADSDADVDVDDDDIDVDDDMDMDEDGFILDTDGDGEYDTVGVDTDGDGYIDTVGVDVDGDGYVDAVGVDTNGDGAIDTVGVDTDGDGAIDTVYVDETAPADTVVADTDGDGEYDTIGVDSDGDGVIDTVGVDTDGDGYVDTVGVDTDGDGAIDTVGVDADGDGYVDAVGVDTNGDGAIDTMGVDTDGDGAIDTVYVDETAPADTVVADTDGDGYVDTVGVDTDGDGAIDTVGVDTDGDGYLDTVGVDTDGDGYVDTVGVDTDGDGSIDTVAVDADGDGYVDAVGVDTDGDGVIDSVVEAVGGGSASGGSVNSKVAAAAAVVAGAAVVGAAVASKVKAKNKAVAPVPAAVTEPVKQKGGKTALIVGISAFVVAVIILVLALFIAGGKSEEVVYSEEYTTEGTQEVTSTEDRVYSNSYDGYTNVRKSPSSKGEVLGKLRNGNEYVVVIGEVDKWLEVEYYGQIGYVHKNYVSETPSKPVTVDVTAKWLEDSWSDGGYWGYYVHKNGKFDLWQQYGDMGSGTWRLEGNEIVFTLTKVTEFGRDFDWCKVGYTERCVINKKARMLGTMKPHVEECNE